jgi:hypothetical protein
MKTPVAFVGSALLLGLVAPPAPAQTTDPSLLTLERIFAAREFEPESFGPARWLRQGAAYTTLEAAPGATPGPAADGPGVRELVLYDTASGRREVLVPAIPRRRNSSATMPMRVGSGGAAVRQSG